MVTSIQVKDDTRRLLDKLKKEMNFRSYDEVIRKLIKSKRGMPESLFGACRGSLLFKREKEAEHVL